MFVLCLSKLKLVEQNHKVTVTCRGKELFGSAKQTEGTILFRAKADISENRRRGRGADKRTEEFIQEGASALGGWKEVSLQS